MRLYQMLTGNLNIQNIPVPERTLNVRSGMVLYLFACCQNGDIFLSRSIMGGMFLMI